MSEIKKYKVLSEIRHNGTRYHLGDSIELEAKDAAGLLKCNAVQLPVSAPKSSGEGAGKPASISPGEVPDEYKSYFEGSNKVQLAFISCGNFDAETLKELLKYSKSKSAQLITKKLKELENAKRFVQQ